MFMEIDDDLTSTGTTLLGAIVGIIEDAMVGAIKSAIVGATEGAIEGAIVGTIEGAIEDAIVSVIVEDTPMSLGSIVVELPVGWIDVKIQGFGLEDLAFIFLARLKL